MQSNGLRRVRRLRNILDFEKDYPEARVVKLEENYRSMGNILAAANAVIANNLTRKPKKLFTSKPAGDKIENIAQVSATPRVN